MIDAETIMKFFGGKKTKSPTKKGAQLGAANKSLQNLESKEAAGEPMSDDDKALLEKLRAEAAAKAP